MWEVMTYYVIMHNMIIEDEHENNLLDQGWDFHGENVEPKYEAATYAQFTQFYQGMRD